MRGGIHIHCAFATALTRPDYLHMNIHEHHLGWLILTTCTQRQHEKLLGQQSMDSHSQSTVTHAG